MIPIRCYDNAADAGYAESILNDAGINSIVVDQFAGPQRGYHLQVDAANAAHALTLLGDDGGQPISAVEEKSIPLNAPPQELPFTVTCRGCKAGWELTSAESRQRQFSCPDCGQTFPILNIDAIPNIWETGPTFPQPKWKRVSEVIRQFYSPEAQPEVWLQAALQWVRHIRAIAGEQYTIYQSKNFIILAPPSVVEKHDVTALCESALATVRSLLGAAAWYWKVGKHVSLLFDDQSAYYSYIADFLTEDTEVARSGGVFLNKGYAHTALAPTSVNRLDLVLAHEYTHLSLVQYRLPLWLNEGLAVNAENAIKARSVQWKSAAGAYGAYSAAGRQGVRWNKDLAAAHKSIWNSETIQAFWSGKSFSNPAQSEVSYSLAEILVANLLEEIPQKMMDFIRDAAWEDAGEAAAQKNFNASLGDVAAQFLGPGDWAPRPGKK